MKYYYSHRSKMKNQPVRIDGYYFPSKKESRRYLELYALQKSKEIQELEVHPRFLININGNYITTYVADFTYWTLGGDIPDKFIIEDVKGRRSGVPYELFKIKKKLMKEINDLEVTEI